MRSCSRAKCRSIRLSRTVLRAGETDRAAEIARQVEQPRRILQSLRRQRAERYVGDRHDGKHHAEAAQHLRHEQLPKLPVFCQPGHLPIAERDHGETERQHQPRIDLGHEPADQRRGQKHGGAGYEQGLADHQRVEAADLAEIDRIEIGETVQADAEHKGEHAADREIAIGERPQIDDRLPRHEQAGEKDCGGAC